MGYIQKNLKSTAQVWVRGASDGYGGYSFTKITIKCRWEDKQVLFRDKSGQERTSKAIIYSDTDVDIGSFILLGTSASSTPPSNAFEVLGFNKSPNIQVTDYERKIII